MNKAYDAIVVGGGPAGLSAAIYLARAKFSVLVLEKEKFGGQITITSEVVNYPGVTEPDRKKTDSGNAGTGESVLAPNSCWLRLKNYSLRMKSKPLKQTKGTFQCAGIVLATGSSPRKLGFKGEKEFQGRGVAYCATCDGEFFTGSEVFVIGGSRLMRQLRKPFSLLNMLVM